MLLSSKKQATVLFVLLLLCPVTGSAPLAAAPQAASYAQMSGVAIGRIIEAVDLINSGKTSQAQHLLRQTKNSLGNLVKQTQRFRDIAINEHQRCVQSQGVLEKRVNDFYAQRQDEAAKIGNLKAQLAEASKRRELSNAEIVKLTNEMRATAARLEQNRAKLQELVNWWWVPGYGAYLGVRTLVDNDIQNLQSAVHQLQDQRLRMQQNQASINSAQALIANLAANIKLTDRVIQDLRTMEASDQAKLVQLKRIAVFLTDADVFWGKAASSLEINGSSFIDTVEILHSKLAEEGEGISFFSLGSQSGINFRQALIAFADSIDRNTNFLLKPSTDLCGGPPRANNITPSRCDISAITQYYEITDPASCSFRYINPPGCPGNPRAIPSAAANALNGSERANWITVADQNWIGRMRCQSAAAMYYGKLPGPAECEAKCKADPQCAMWTFNVSNGYMPDSVHECWGATRQSSPNKQKWGGFQSGGIAPP